MREDTSAKMMSIEVFSATRKTLSNNGESVVLMKGVYDMLHAGHVRSFLNGAMLSDRLVVAVTIDDVVRRNKGDSRPIIPFSDRLFIVANLSVVDFVIPNPFSDLRNLLATVQPDVFSASHFSDLGEIERAAMYPETRFVVTPKDGEYDTSQIIRRIKEGKRNETESAC